MPCIKGRGSAREILQMDSQRHTLRQQPGRKPKLGCWLLSPTVDDTSAHTVGCGIFRDCRMTFAFLQLCCDALKHECWITFALFFEHRSASFTIREVRREWDDGILTPFRLYVWVAQYCA